MLKKMQSYIEKSFPLWRPSCPEMTSRSQRDVTLSYVQPGLQFLEGSLLYVVQRKEKLPPWVVVYSGGKSSKTIENLAPCTPHKFRIKVIIKAEAVKYLAEKAIKYYGEEDIAFERIKDLFKDAPNSDEIDDNGVKLQESGDHVVENSSSSRMPNARRWLESQPSAELWTSTEAEGSSSPCFCMSVQGGYLKQVQTMLEERPALIEIINPNSGYSPLATAVRQGDVAMVRFLLSAGADVEQRSRTGQTALHLAALAASIPVFDALLEKEPDFQAVDINDLRVEHYAVDSGQVDMVRHVLSHGGDLSVRDNNGWTPLFRAVVQGANTAMIEELVHSGSELNIVDAAGLSLASAARILTNRHGKARESVVRLVDPHFPHEKALANFTRLTNKISSVNTISKI